MQIVLNNLGKRFNRHWVFRHLNYNFFSGNAYAITGANGSGKSTLLQVLAGAVQQSEGSVFFGAGSQTSYVIKPTVDGKSGIRHHASGIPVEQHYQQLSIAAPYLELIEDFTLTEFLSFHFKFKKILPGQTVASIMSAIGLTDAADKQIRNYSSGMKQRVKLAQAIFSDVPVILLDEPTNNLDIAGINLYKWLITEFCADRLLIICSNDENEIAICKERIAMVDYK